MGCPKSYATLLQKMLFKNKLEELIPKDHVVRVVNETIDNLNVEPLLATYKGGGTSAYHPVMLLKVKKLEKNLKKNLDRNLKNTNNKNRFLTSEIVTQKLIPFVLLVMPHTAVKKIIPFLNDA